MKVLIFLRNDFIGGVAYNAGEICGWPDHVAAKLCQDRPGGAYAKLYGNGEVQKIDGKIPGAEDWWSRKRLDEHVAQLKKEGKWAPPPPIVVKDLEVERAARERARDELNQI
jgi:hypothetical protein